jgi:hypothetical protein
MDAGKIHPAAFPSVLRKGRRRVINRKVCLVAGPVFGSGRRRIAFLTEQEIAFHGPTLDRDSFRDFNCFGGPFRASAVD